MPEITANLVWDGQNK